MPMTAFVFRRLFSGDAIERHARVRRPIAFRAGGVLETLRPEDTEFFDEPTVASLVAGVNRFLERERQGDFVVDRSRLVAFSRAEFQRKILDLIEARAKL